MRKISSVLSWIILIALLVLNFYGNPFVRWKIAYQTGQYLIEEQGYQLDEIAKIKGDYRKNEVLKYSAIVTFSDDLQGEYVYGYNLEDLIYQSDGIDGPHSELLKENEVEWASLDEFYTEIEEELLVGGMDEEDFAIREVDFINPLGGNFGLYALVDLYDQGISIEYRKGQSGDVYIFKETAVEKFEKIAP